MALIIGVTAFSYDSADDFTILYISVSIITITIMILTTFCDNYRFIAVHSFEFQLFCTFSNSSLLCRFFFCYICFADKFGKHKAFIFTLVLNILFSFDHYSNILSSKTAALLLTAGFLMALNAIRNKRYSLPFWIGVLEVIFGTFLCFKYFFVGLAFLLHSSSVI